MNMFSKIKNALSPTRSSSSSSGSDDVSPPRSKTAWPLKFPYSRPHFMELSDENLLTSADHKLRPIVTPNYGLPLCVGYAECINGGKSKWNEDQAVMHRGVLWSGSCATPYLFYALFDGHAGIGAAMSSAKQMHHIVNERLIDAQDDIWRECVLSENTNKQNLLVIGALEAAFKEMDDIIKQDHYALQTNGGCTAIVAVVVFGKVFIANAGDSRAVICKGDRFQQLSTDFTPESEKARIRQLAQVKPELLGNEFTCMEYVRPLKIQDLGKRIMYRDAFMTGWAYKTIDQTDLKLPLISGQGKKSRVMGTIGVTRGFGDHDLHSIHLKVPIKPFLSCHPEVQIYDLTGCGENDVLILGTDGLWDVIDGNSALQIVNNAMQGFPIKERYASAATCLVAGARGTLHERNWILQDERLASVDDISVFVIPLCFCAQLIYPGMTRIMDETKGEPDELTDSIEEDLTDNIEGELTDSDEEELTDNIEGELTNNFEEVLTDNIEEELIGNIEEELVEDIEEELADDIEAELINDIEEELTDNIEENEWEDYDDSEILASQLQPTAPLATATRRRKRNATHKASKSTIFSNAIKFFVFNQKIHHSQRKPATVKYEFPKFPLVTFDQDDKWEDFDEREDDIETSTESATAELDSQPSVSGLQPSGAVKLTTGRAKQKLMIEKMRRMPQYRDEGNQLNMLENIYESVELSRQNRIASLASRSGDVTRQRAPSHPASEMPREIEGDILRRTECAPNLIESYRTLKNRSSLLEKGHITLPNPFAPLTGSGRYPDVRISFPKSKFKPQPSTFRRPKPQPSTSRRPIPQAGTSKINPTTPQADESSSDD